ncbi:MAG: division/cell wall cluster transcriptional repressor MraZ [Bacillota bacterium]|nr:division/cell wall cluster transcriptional repressor MraZ [Bacillota bacterium]
MLIGKHQHNIDAKGRVIIPSSFREDFGELCYITQGTDGCLFILSCDQWNKLKEKICAMPISKARWLQRIFFSGAAEVEPNAQGRISIPEPLRQYAHLEKEVYIIGSGERAEIWDAATWDSKFKEQPEDPMLEAMSLLEL